MAEIAGIVLGGFPLIISALEHYRDGFEPLREWWKFESEFGNFIEELGTQQTRFDMNLEKLLDPFVTSGSQMNAFLDQRNPQAWQDPAFEGDIRKRLGHSYEWYIAICRKMNDTLSNLEERLGIEDGQVGYIDASKWDHELRRLRISFSRKKFKHVKLLAKYNDELSQLLSSNDELRPSRKRRRKTSLITLAQSLQHHSQVLYSSLLNRWICKCTTPHETRLLLERHSEANESALSLHLLLEAAGVSRPIEVRIDDYSLQKTSGFLVPDSANTNWLQLRQQIHEREVKLAPASPPIPTNNTLVHSLQSMTVTGKTSASSSSSQLAQITSTRKSLFSSRSKKTARFAATATATSSIPSIPTRLTADEIKDICSEISGWKSKADCLGFIPVAPRLRFLFYPTSRHKNLEQQYFTVTLEDILPSRIHQFNDSQKMTRKQRFTLANILAFTLLQLQPTPWLPSNWSKRDITFICPASSTSPELSHPYIGKTFPAIPSTTPASKAECKQSLLRLGILLLELTFNERLETLPLRQKYLGPQGIPNEYTDLCTAKEWHREVEGECGEGLSEVIRRCIDCSFGEKPDWNSEAFLEEYFGHVLEPLKELLQQWESSA